MPIIHKIVINYFCFNLADFPVRPDDLAAEQYEYTIKKLKDADFIHYEISNWSKKGFQSIHNSAYWDMSEYLGIGAGAHSFLSNKRFSNVKNPKEYISTLQEMKADVNNAIKMKQVVDGDVPEWYTPPKGFDGSKYKDLAGGA